MTGTRRPSILARARPLMLARLLVAVTTFVLPVILARVLLPASYGTFKQAWLVASTLRYVLPLNLPASLYYFVPREPERRGGFIAQAVLLCAAMGAVAGLALLAAGPAISRGFRNPELDAHLGWVAAFTGLLVAGAPLDAAYASLGRLRAAAVTRGATEVGRAAAMIAGVLVTRDVTGLFAGIAVSSAVRAVACVGLLGREFGLAPSRAAARELLSFTLPLAAAFLLGMPQQQFHQYAVGATVSAAAFAIYSVGCFQLPLVDVLYTPVSEILQIGFAEEDGRGGRGHLALFHEAVSRLAFALLPTMAVLWVVAPVFLAFLFTDAYVDAAPVMRLSLVSIAFAALPLDGVLRAGAQNRFVLWTSALRLALTVALVLAGLSALGPVGAMAGHIAAEGATRALLLRRAARVLRAPLRDALPWRDLSRQAAAGVAGLPAAWLGLHAAAHPFPRLAAAGILFAVVYLGALRAMGALDLSWVRRPLRARRPPGAAREAARSAPVGEARLAGPPER
jgi:O-antigen/teichoic acid export membrane protein